MAAALHFVCPCAPTAEAGLKASEWLRRLLSGPASRLSRLSRLPSLRLSHIPAVCTFIAMHLHRASPAWRLDRDHRPT